MSNIANFSPGSESYTHTPPTVEQILIFYPESEQAHYKSTRNITDMHYPERRLWTIHESCTGLYMLSYAQVLHRNAQAFYITAHPGRREP